LLRLATLQDRSGNTDWVVMTPEGLFDGTRSGRDAIAYRGDGLGLIPLDRFFQDFYYPGLLASIWRGERPLPGKPLTVFGGIRQPFRRESCTRHGVISPPASVPRAVPVDTPEWRGSASP
jgi:hypothetical protein